jgi:Glyoxalase/Bleomycin resistance protein/Dioxygenase superfamily
MADHNFFHVGMIVPRLEPALDDLGALLGLTWRPIIDSEVPVHEPAGGADRTLRLRFAYSVEAPHLEVIEAVPDSPWALSEGSNLHHLGFWSDDVPGDAAGFERARCPLEVCMTAPGDRWPVAFSYHRAHGVRLELVDRANQAVLFPELAER